MADTNPNESPSSGEAGGSLAGGEGWWSRPCGGRDVLAIALPLVVQTAFWSVMWFIDRMFLTWYSADAMAAADGHHAVRIRGTRFREQTRRGGGVRRIRCGEAAHREAIDVKPEERRVMRIA